MAKKLYYKIGEACKSLDIQPYVLRYWETEFPALRPNKSKSGQRVYSEQDLLVIRRIKELLYDEGYTIAGAKKKLESEDPVALAAGAEPPDSEPELETEAAPEPEPAPKPRPAKKPAKKAEALVSKPKAAAQKASKPAEPAPMSAEVRKGLEKALAETRSILEILDKKSRWG